MRQTRTCEVAVVTSYRSSNMLRALSSRSLKLCGKFGGLSSTDLSCHARLLSTDSDAAPRRVSSLRKQRSLRRKSARPQAAEHIKLPTEADFITAEPVHLSRSQRTKWNQTGISVSTLRHQLGDAVSSPQPSAELEFPSDILADEKLEEFSRRDQARDAFRPSINPMDTSIVLFPGQSSQFVGMGSKLLAYPAVEKMYKTASNILGYNLLDMCLYGPKDVLSKTVHSQPAVLVTSLAAVEKLKEVCPKVQCSQCLCFLTDSMMLGICVKLPVITLV